MDDRVDLLLECGGFVVVTKSLRTVDLLVQFLDPAPIGCLGLCVDQRPGVAEHVSIGRSVVGGVC